MHPQSEVTWGEEMKGGWKVLNDIGFAVFHLVVWSLLGLRLIPTVSRVFGEMLDGAALPALTLMVLRVGATGCLVWGVIGAGIGFAVGRSGWPAATRGAVLALLVLVFAVASGSLLLPLLRMHA